MEMPLEPNVRLRLRKGTTSCRECKRRKRRCTYASTGACTACRLRGLVCVGQDAPGEEDQRHIQTSSDLREQLNRVEHLLREVVVAVEAAEATEAKVTNRHDVRMESVETEKGRHGIDVEMPLVETPEAKEVDGRTLSVETYRSASPASPTSPASAPAPSNAIPASVAPESVMTTLLAALPCAEDYRTLVRGSHLVGRAFQVFNSGREILQSRAEFEATVGTPVDEVPIPSMPDARAHPVLLARQMLYWALFLQCPWNRTQYEFRADVVVLMRQLARAAHAVNVADELQGSAESVECLLLETQFHLHLGSLRRAWMLNRRAMLQGVLMGMHRVPVWAATTQPWLHKLDPLSVFMPGTLWERMVFLDRFLSLLLGLPPDTSGGGGTSAAVPASTLQANPLLWLERTLSGVAAQLLERNARGLMSGRLGPEHDADVLDAALLQAAEAMPALFWQVPSLDSITLYSYDDVVLVNRLVVQMYYFYLLIQLHLPYMLSFIGGATSSEASAYASVSCTNASREILRRFVAYRRFNSSSLLFRPVDFAALTAALTLLLAHLDAHLGARNRPTMSCPAYKLLAHQRVADRALLADVLAQLDIVSASNHDTMSAAHATMLRSLLAIEKQAFRPVAGSTGVDTCAMAAATATTATTTTTTSSSVLLITIPYFGAVCITWDGRISRVFAAENSGGDDGDATAAVADNSTTRMPTQSYWARVIDRPPQGVFDDAVATTSLDGGLATDWGLAVTGGKDNWAFQGVDTAFFDSLTMLGDPWQG